MTVPPPPPSRPNPRARRRDANRDRILDAAMEAVTVGGFAALSINKLAETVDYTPAALYRYFESKDALVAALVQRVLATLSFEIADAADAAARSHAPGPLPRIFAMVHAYRRFAAAQPHAWSMLAMSLAEPRVLVAQDSAATAVVQRMAAAFSPLAVALDEAATRAELEPGDLQTRSLLLFAAVHGALLLRKQRHRAPHPLDVAQLAIEGVRSLLRGWGASHDELDAAIDHVTRLGMAADTTGKETP